MLFERKLFWHSVVYHAIQLLILPGCWIFPNLLFFFFYNLKPHCHPAPTKIPVLIPHCLDIIKSERQVNIGIMSPVIFPKLCSWYILSRGQVESAPWAGCAVQKEREEQAVTKFAIFYFLLFRPEIFIGHDNCPSMIYLSRSLLIFSVPYPWSTFSIANPCCSLPRTVSNLVQGDTSIMEVAKRARLISCLDLEFQDWAHTMTNTSRIKDSLHADSKEWLCPNI